MGVEVVRGDITDRAQSRPRARASTACFTRRPLPGIERRLAAVRSRPTSAARSMSSTRAAARALPRLVYTSSPSVTFAGLDQCGVDESAPLRLRLAAENCRPLLAQQSLAEQAVLAGQRRDAAHVCTPAASHLGPAGRPPHPAAHRPRPPRPAAPRRRRHEPRRHHLCRKCGGCAPRGGRRAGRRRLACGRSRVLHFSQGEPVNCWQWIDEVLALAGLPPVQKSISFKSAWRLGAVCETAYRWLGLRGEPPMTRFLAAQLARSHWYDIAAARRDLGYRAEGFDAPRAWDGLANGSPAPPSEFWQSRTKIGRFVSVSADRMLCSAILSIHVHPVIAVHSIASDLRPPRAPNPYLRRTSRHPRRPDRHPVRLGRHLPRPRRRAVRRPARPLRQDAGRVQPARHGARRDRAQQAAARRVRRQGHRRRRRAARGDGQPQAGDGQDRAARHRAASCSTRASRRRFRPTPTPRTCPPRTCGSSTAISTCGGPSCSG